MIYIKPLLKWVGGKTQILNNIIPDFPINISNYHEFFIGGGSVLLALLENIINKTITISGKIYAYDSNESLINLYKNIQTNSINIYDKLQEIITDFNSKKNIKENTDESKETYYYSIRTKYNNLTQLEKNSVLGSALFIFLNKTCFRGLFRIGPNGFNVPYGHNKNPEIINKEHLLKVSHLIQNVDFRYCDFSDAINNIKEGDFIYLDPPYAPETTTSFVGYNKSGFSKEQHIKLFQFCQNLKLSKFLMSNANVLLVHEYFPKDKFNIQVLECKRKINSKKPNAKTTEVLIKNY
jgi:DNA adenine methylase